MPHTFCFIEGKCYHVRPAAPSPLFQDAGGYKTSSHSRLVSRDVHRCSSSSSCWPTLSTLPCPPTCCHPVWPKRGRDDLSLEPSLPLKCKIRRTEPRITGPWRNSGAVVLSAMIHFIPAQSVDPVLIHASAHTLKICRPLVSFFAPVTLPPAGRGWTWWEKCTTVLQSSPAVLWRTVTTLWPEAIPSTTASPGSVWSAGSSPSKHWYWFRFNPALLSLNSRFDHILLLPQGFCVPE